MPDEFDRMQYRQHAYRARRRQPRWHPRPAMVAAIGIPVVILAVIGAILAPVVYEGTRAYQDVFNNDVPRDEQPVIAMVNPAGTPVLSTPTPLPEEAEPIPQWDGKERITLLLLGIDRREEEATRSDTMILVNVDPVAKTARMMSIPRDMRVFIPGYGLQKINAAYAFGDRDQVPGGGPGLTIRTIEANFGIRINYFAEVDFDGFVKIVDTVGGVTVNVPYPIKDDAYPAEGNNYTRVYFPTGWQHLTGKQALQYARTRHDDGDSSRSARQQQILLALRQQAVTFDLLPKAADLLGEVGDAVRTDLSFSQALQLGRLAAEFTAEDIQQTSLFPGLVEEALPGEPYYLIPDWDVCADILSEFTGATVTPPASALADPDLAIPIRVANGSSIPGLAQRVAELLTANGFTNVTVAEDGTALPTSVTRLVDSSTNLATAMYVAGAIGVGIESIDVSADESGGASPVATGPARTPENGGIVIVLGDDAPDPAYFEVISVDEEIVPTDPAVDDTWSDPSIGEDATDPWAETGG